MKEVIERLQENIEADTAFSFTVPERNWEASVETESNTVTHSANDSPSPPYTPTRLTDTSVCTMTDWLDDDYLQSMNNEDVIAQLDEILLLLITLREGASGKELTQDLRRLFGADLSPGTVYPHLNDLADDEILDVTDLKKRKIYTTNNIEDMFDIVVPMVNRQVVFSLVMKALLISIKEQCSQSQWVGLNG